MASPWKFLARLVSPRRQQGQELDVTDEVTPDGPAIAKSTENPADAMLASTDQPTGEEPPPHSEPVVASTAAQHSAAVISAPGTRDVESTDIAEAADPVRPESSDTADREVLNTAQLRQRVEPGRRRRGKKADVLEVVPPSSADVLVVSDDTLSLDEEIRVLRQQLANKLQQQNAQLKRMLERFER
ncbi:hypothetical protein [Neorhizobium huautlense]|uniref:hypothetical protein n=1 Tax=Neorhizobium huautlense TaxID=67774 RepID=UPI000CF8C440|nr:hypothetical protein [Neorhizobium huautlense]